MFFVAFREGLGVCDPQGSMVRAKPQGIPRGRNVTDAGDISMKTFTPLIVGGLVLALCAVGYLYYQRTANDITIQLPKVSLTK